MRGPWSLLTLMITHLLREALLGPARHRPRTPVQQEIALPPASPNPRPEVPPPSRSGAFLAAHWLRGPSVLEGRSPGHPAQFQAASHPVPPLPQPASKQPASTRGSFSPFISPALLPLSPYSLCPFDSPEAQFLSSTSSPRHQQARRPGPKRMLRF